MCALCQCWALLRPGWQWWQCGWHGHEHFTQQAKAVQSPEAPTKHGALAQRYRGSSKARSKMSVGVEWSTALFPYQHPRLPKLPKPAIRDCLILNN